MKNLFRHAFSLMASSSISLLSKIVILSSMSGFYLCYSSLNIKHNFLPVQVNIPTTPLSPHITHLTLGCLCGVFCFTEMVVQSSLFPPANTHLNELERLSGSSTKK
ncbi:hypothetical protein XENTR_v10001448 [Xenopus tropicalis]|nr:hypothetical protein XENTR_v10001448 [Xenopus tropicalis]